MADDAGALLVRSGLVSASALDEARARVESLGGTLGEQLVTAGALGDDVLTDFYKTRLLVPQVNPNTLARLATKVIATIPQDMAIELRVVPVSIDKDNNLTVAMSDPSDRHAVDEIAFFTGAYVVRAVATQMQIAWCLAHYYGHITALGQKLLQPTVAQPAVSPAAQAAVRSRSPAVSAGQISALRHHAVAPGVEPTSPRPSGELDEVTTIGAPMPSESDREADAIPDHQPPATSISGELRAPVRRAPSIRPLPDPHEERDLDDEDLDADTDAVVVLNLAPDLSEPTISIEAGEPDDDPTGQSRPAPARKRKAKTDPPELAARAGEIGLKTGPVKTVTIEESSIVIDDEVLDPPPPIVRAKTGDQLPDISGEVRVADSRDQGVTSGRTVEVTDEVSEAVVIHDNYTPESQPIVLERKRVTSDAPTNVASPLVVFDQDDEDVVVLNARKPGPTTPRRSDRRTQVGVGAVTAATRAKHDLEPGGGIPRDIDDQATGARTAPIDNDSTRVDTLAAPLPEDYTPSEGGVAAPPIAGHDDDDALAPAPVAGAPLPRRQISLDGVVQRAPSATDDEDDGGPATSVMSAVELDDVIPERKAEVVPAHLTQARVDYDPTDDGWGLPGTTIPPPLLGAIPGSLEAPYGMIPMPNLESAPLMVAPPVPPEVQRGIPVIAPPPQGLARALEEATQGVLDLIRGLDQAGDRDEVVAMMIKHLSEAHRRAGFLAARAGELSLFAMNPRMSTMPTATLRLDRPSTLQDVVGTRLPYRGPMHDDASRTFLMSVLGGCPPEILLVPISIRERVVGVLFGEHRLRHTFDDQLSLAARAAGMALERILKAKRT